MNIVPTRDQNLIFDCTTGNISSYLAAATNGAAGCLQLLRRAVLSENPDSLTAESPNNAVATSQALASPGSGALSGGIREDEASFDIVLFQFVL